MLTARQIEQIDAVEAEISFMIETTTGIVPDDERGFLLIKEIYDLLAEFVVHNHGDLMEFYPYVDE